MGKICGFSLKDVKSRLLVFTEREPGTDFHLYLIEDKKIKIVFFFQFKFQGTFHYDSQFWSNRSAYNLNFQEAILALTYKRKSYRPTGEHPSPRSASVWGSTIHSDSLSSTSRPTLSTPLSLMGNTATPQWVVTRGSCWLAHRSPCSPTAIKEGFNAVGDSPSHSKAWIGIIANQQNDCSSRDSRIGFGAWGLFDVSNSCGNEATHSPDNGNKHIKAWCSERGHR